MNKIEEILNKATMRPDEAALVLEVSSRTVRRWLDWGILEGMKVEKSTRIVTESVKRVKNGDDGGRR